MVVIFEEKKTGAATGKRIGPRADCDPACLAPPMVCTAPSPARYRQIGIGGAIVGGMDRGDETVWLLLRAIFLDLLETVSVEPLDGRQSGIAVKDKWRLLIDGYGLWEK